MISTVTKSLCYSWSMRAARVRLVIKNSLFIYLRQAISGSRELSNTEQRHDAKNLILITGGARSGKSQFAEKLASANFERVVYIATMEEFVSDQEAVDRIARHRSRRPPGWITVEQPVGAESAIGALAAGKSACIFDCLSLYVSNIVLASFQAGRDYDTIEREIGQAIDELLSAIGNKPQIEFLMVTNEVGWGIVPENRLARMYRDLLGIANQTCAAAAREVWLSCAGLQIRMKPQ